MGNDICWRQKDSRRLIPGQVCGRLVTARQRIEHRGGTRAQILCRGVRRATNQGSAADSKSRGAEAPVGDVDVEERRSGGEVVHCARTSVVDGSLGSRHGSGIGRLGNLVDGAVGEGAAMIAAAAGSARAGKTGQTASDGRTLG